MDDLTGRFRIDALLGEGGMGRVYGAVHLDSGLEVALKVVNPGATNRERFAHEARAVAGLDHPHIVRVYDQGVTTDGIDGRIAPGSSWLAMERAHDTLAATPPATWSGVSGCLDAVLQALAHAHARDLIHGDVKAANVLRMAGAEPPDGLRLADFGISWMPTRATRRAGTPSSMAPEQIQGHDLGPWTDLYAVGCLAWFLLTGSPPFGHGPSEEVLAAHLLQQPGELRTAMAVPEDLASWMSALLAKAPEARFQRAADARHALHALSARLVTTGTVAWGNGPAFTVTVATVDTAADLPGVAVSGQAADLVEPARAPLPTTWRDDTHTARPRHLDGLGTRLFGLRELPVVGRDADKDRLWAAMRAAPGAGQRVVIAGPSGTGRHHLARWLVQRGHALGATDTLEAGSAWWDARPERVGVVVLDEPDATTLARPVPRGVMVLALVRVVPETLPEDTTVVTLTPLSRPPTALLVHDLLGLEPALAAIVEEACEGYPGVAVRIVGDWIDAGHLEVTPHGFGPRAGQTLGPRLEGDFDALVGRARQALWREGARRSLRVVAEARLVGAREGVPATDSRLGLLDAEEVHARAQLGQLDAAVALCQTARRRATRFGWTRALAELDAFDADVARFEGRDDEALALLARARERFGAALDPSGEARCALASARVCRRLQRFEQAEEALDFAERTWQRLGREPALVSVRRDRAMLLVDQGRHAEARDQLIAVRDALPTDEAHLRAELCASLGTVYLDLGALDEAEAAFREAEALYDAVGHIARWMATVNLGRVDVLRGRWGEARRALELAFHHMERIAGGRSPSLLTYRSLLLPCLAVAGEWEAWDALIDELMAISPGQSLVAENAELALAHAPPEHAARARALVAVHQS